MKFRIRKIAAIGLTLMLSSTAWSDVIVGGPYNGTDVGSIDSILATTTDLSAGGTNGCGTSSNPTNEECWAETIIAADLIFDGKDETVDWYNTDNGNVAFQLIFGPGHYILKNGIGGGSSRWVLLVNNASSAWGVLAGGFDLHLGNDMTISHATQFEGDDCCNQVPEPGTLALLGLGLVGLGLTRRRQRI